MSDANITLAQLGERYANFYTDFAFKKLFGTEANKDLLISFLNALLSGKEKIKNITYLPTEQLGAAIDNRRAIFDIYCENEDGDRFIIEMQKAEQEYFKDRAVYYSSFPIRDCAPKGVWNYGLKRIYCIGILGFRFDKDSKKVKTTVQLTDIDTNVVFYDKLTYIFLEMPNFNKTIDELSGMYDKWLYAISNLDCLIERPAVLREKIFKKLFDVAEIAKFTQAERRDYEESLKVMRDNYAVMTTKYNTGYRDGAAEERAKAYQEKLDMARRMKSDSVPIPTIAKYTGLSEDEIANL